MMHETFFPTDNEVIATAACEFDESRGNGVDTLTFVTDACLTDGR